MNPFRRHLLLCLGLFLWLAPGARAQVEPHIGYVYPAGGRRSTEFEVTIGGQYLNGVSDVIVSGKGVEATVGKHTKPLTNKRQNELKQKLQQVKRRLGEQRARQKSGKRGPVETFASIAEELGESEEILMEYSEIRKKLNDPKTQPNPQIAETVRLQIQIDPEASDGERELRLMAASGLSNPVRFHVGRLPEHSEIEPNDVTVDTPIAEELPLTINGQIMPGDVDRFRFKARRGMKLVVAASAQKLVPYLADAVPGWFQATMVLHNSRGEEVAYADDYRFHPDPVLFCEIPTTGEYILSIKDSIYRGREDFVYRITLGEIPFVTGIFPLGGPRDERTTIALEGWNLPVNSLTLNTQGKTPGIYPISVRNSQLASNQVPFAIGSLTEGLEEEPNNDRAAAQRFKPPMILNGRIDQPGDEDVFCFECRAGGQIFAEVQARRLDSPVDSVLKLTDAAGRTLAVNDDHEDKAAGLTTHHADSRISVTIPQDGLYYLHLADAQYQGGSDHIYRLAVNAQRANYQLRVVPASLNARAGSTVPITVFALRKDGFEGTIKLGLQDAPAGFRLSGGWVPAGQDQVRLTLTVPRTAAAKPFSLRMEGVATAGGREIRRLAVPAEDMMQAFIYHHLVTAKDWMVAVTGRAKSGKGGPARSNWPSPQKPLELPLGSTASLRISLPVGTNAVPNQIKLSLSDPPEGISIERVSPGQAALTMLLKGTAGEIESGVKGNLIVEAFIERPQGNSGNTRRVLLGTLPAIPFEVVGVRTGLASGKTGPGQ